MADLTELRAELEKLKEDVSETREELDEISLALGEIREELEELKESMNLLFCKRKRGSVKGEEANAVKRVLTGEEVRVLYDSGVTVKEIAARAMIVPSSVYAILRQYK